MKFWILGSQKLKVSHQETKCGERARKFWERASFWKSLWLAWVPSVGSANWNCPAIFSGHGTALDFYQPRALLCVLFLWHATSRAGLCFFSVVHQIGFSKWMLINYLAAALAVVSRRETLTPQCAHPDGHFRDLSAGICLWAQTSSVHLCFSCSLPAHYNSLISWV